MIDMIKNAKDLINKGKELNDPELIQMGMELLEQYKTQDDTPKDIKQAEDKYICQNCGHEMLADKLRKRCLKCKKHKLKLIEELKIQDKNLQLIEEFNNIEQTIPHNSNKTNKTDIDDFTTQIRNTKGNKRFVDGVEDGVYTHAEQIEFGIANVWSDDGTEEQDETNETLKKFTKISSRTRQPPQKKIVKCTRCGKEELVHPIHTVGTQHLCIKCIQRKGSR